MPALNVLAFERGPAAKGQALEPTYFIQILKW